MKHKVILLSGFYLMLSVFSFSQEKRYVSDKIVETNFFRNNPALGGDVIINSSTKEVVGEKSYLTFEVDAPQAGRYYLNAWILPSQSADGSYTVYDIQINGTNIPAGFKPLKPGWQSLELSEAVDLKSGKNTVTVVAKVPEIPHVDFVRLSPTAEKASISSAKYDEYAAKLLSRSKASLLESSFSSGTATDAVSETVRAAAATTTTTTTTTTFMLTPLANFEYREGVELQYTFHVDFVFYEGQQIFVATDGKYDHAHILEIHNLDEPESYSWSAESNSQHLASLNINIPISGTYYIRVRSKRAGDAGLVGVNVNGWSYFNNVTVSNTGYFQIAQPAGRVYNTFTANSTANPCIWIEKGSTGKTVGWNRDYFYHPTFSDYNWGSEARVKKQYAGGADVVTVSAQNAYDPVGTCDLYVGCMDSDILPHFENLKADDAIQSAPADWNYNCISWSGGITDYWEWPLNEWSDYYVQGNDLASFDMFYLYPRYPGCAMYSRNGVTPENAVVDLWGFGIGYGYEDYTHASIRGQSDGYAHGYDWESKPGSLMRTFHPRDAIRGASYGQILRSYRRIGTANSYSLAESIADGNSVMESVAFNELEKSVIGAGIQALPVSVKDRFAGLYEAWKETWLNSPFSNPDKFRNSQYEALLKYCKSVSGSRYLVFEKLGGGDIFNMLLVRDLTLTGSVANQAILKSIKASNKAKSTITTGATIIRSPYSNCMKYVKSLIGAGNSSQVSLSKAEEMLTGTDGIRYSNMDEFTVQVNGPEILIELLLNEDTRISIDILTLRGEVISSLAKSLDLRSGAHRYSDNVQPGIYLVRYVMNGNVNVKKVVVN